MEFFPSYFLWSAVPADALVGHYDMSLVALSYVIAVLASYVALDIAGRLRAEKNLKASFSWLMGGAFAMGAGIWSMHFIGMIAFRMSHESYDLSWTAGSLFVAMLVSFFALSLLRIENRPVSTLIGGGILLGIGIATMHYTGMQGMSSHVQIHYIPSIYFLSVVIAIVAAEAALWLIVQSNRGSLRRQFFLKACSALVMGLAICGMHYTGMAAAVFTPLPGAEMNPLGIAPDMLAFYIAGVSGMIIIVALIVSTYKQLMETAIRSERDFLNALLDNLQSGILACNANGKMTRFNTVYQKMFGMPESDTFPTNWRDFYNLYEPNHEDPIRERDRPIFRALDGEHVHQVELDLKLKNGIMRNVEFNGQQIVNADGRKIGAVISVQDISEQKRMEKELVHQATHDMLTNLPNRVLLMDRLEQGIKRAKRMNANLAVLFLDVDQFKLINDSLGHALGDELLKGVAERLESCMRKTDTVARLGGDEFVVLLSEFKNEEDVGRVAQQIAVTLSKPFQVEKKEFCVSTSIGISIFPRDGENADILVRNADTAMYRVKASGRNGFKFYSKEMNVKVQKRLQLEQPLFQAVSKNEFVLYYQPIIDTHTGYVAGLEALLRWQNPDLGFLQPLEFISLAEETGLIIPIGEWVLRTACAQAKAWQDSGFPRVRMSVNVSGRQFETENFPQMVEKILKEIGLDPDCLELELTESVILQHPEEMIKTLKFLKELGVHISLDDFGTGYSSLGYLRRLPVDKLKIDKTFTQEISSNRETENVILAILSLASSMKMKVTAEGTETESQLAFLRFNHCDQIQGYYFSKPLTVEECTELLRKNPCFNVKGNKSNNNAWPS